MGVESIPPPPPPPVLVPTQLVRAVYRSLRARLLVVRVLLVLTSVGAGVFVTLAVRALAINDWSTPAGYRAGEIAVTAGLATTLCFFASYVALAVWTSRAYRNLFALSVSDLRFTPGWGAGAWFVPFLNLVRPKQIVDDVWRATDGEPERWSWRSAPVDASLHAWWAFLVASLFLATRLDMDEFDRGSVQLGLLGAACLVAFSTLSWLVTSQLTCRQDSLAEQHGLPVQPAGTRLSMSGVALVITGAAVGLGAGAVIKLPADSELGSTFVTDIDVGDCFGIPGATATPTPGQNEEVFGVDVVPCDVPHMYELIDVVFHEAKSDAEFPGTDALFEYGTQPCLEDFEEIVGTPFLESELDLLVITPLAEGWRLGDRDLDCVAMRLDGEPLEQTVVGSGL